MGSEGATITFSSDPKNGSACLLCIGDGIKRKRDRKSLLKKKETHEEDGSLSYLKGYQQERLEKSTRVALGIFLIAITYRQYYTDKLEKHVTQTRHQTLNAIT